MSANQGAALPAAGQLSPGTRSQSADGAGGARIGASQKVPLSRRRRPVKQRTCVGCRNRASAAALVRVVARDGVLTPDDHGGLPGRGAHLHQSLDCLDVAAQRRAWTRALKVPGPLDDSLLRERLTQSRPPTSVTPAFEHERAGESE